MILNRHKILIIMDWLLFDILDELNVNNCYLMFVTGYMRLLFHYTVCILGSNGSLWGRR